LAPRSGGAFPCVGPELAYEGDVSLMASELDVTRQIISDYRTMILARR